MNKVLVVVDMQNDFITGSLGTKEAEAIVPYVAEKIRNWDGDIIVTMDTHFSDYLETQEGTKLPISHCITGTKGHLLAEEIYNEITPKRKNVDTILKETFGSSKLSQRIEARDPDFVEFVGLCTDICVISNVLLTKAFLPWIPLFVDAKGCAGTTPEKHLEALSIMESCQVEVKR